MSELAIQLKKDLVTAMKDHDDLTKNVLRMVSSELKNAQIDNQGRDLDDDQVIAVLTRLSKQRKDSISSYQSAGREDLAQQEQSELSVIEKYLPRQLSDAELSYIVSQVMSETESHDFGFVMKQVMSKVQGQADGSRVREIVQKSLA